MKFSLFLILGLLVLKTMAADEDGTDQTCDPKNDQCKSSLGGIIDYCCAHIVTKTGGDRYECYKHITVTSMNLTTITTGDVSKIWCGSTFIKAAASFFVGALAFASLS